MPRTPRPERISVIPVLVVDPEYCHGCQPGPLTSPLRLCSPCLIRQRTFLFDSLNGHDREALAKYCFKPSTPASEMVLT